jgi:hypothetical protein
MPEVDNTYKRRAALLVKDARSGAYSSKTMVALKNYWNEGAAGRIGGAAVGSIITSAAAVGATALATAGGVALAAATFGIGPAVGVVLTYGLLKTLAEVKYSRASKDVKAGMKQDPLDDDSDELQWVIKDPSLLVPATLKVLKKLVRVKRRADQLSGGVTGALSSLRHAKTAAQSFLKNQGLMSTNSRLFPTSGQSVTDRELNDRLFELQFYGQMLFNFVQKLIDDVAVKKRDEAAEACSVIEAHILRQVHFTGNHFACKNCYGMSDAEYNQRLRELGTSGQMTPNIKMTAANPVHNSDNLMDALRQMQKNAQQVQMSSAMNQHVATWGFRGAVSAPGIKGAAGALGIMGSAAPATVEGAAKGSGMGVGAGIVVAELMRTVTNRLTRRSVLKPTRLHGAFELLQVGEDARQETFQEFQKLLESQDVVIRAPRVSEKCAHYIKKLDEIQADLLSSFSSLRRARNFDRSYFYTCDEAYQAAYAFTYFFRNCEKFVAFLVYLEVILLQIDLQVAKLGIGLQPGDLIKPDRPTPPKPSTVS